MKASRLLLHYAKENNRLVHIFNGQFNTSAMLRNIQVEMMGRHVLVEKDFTKIKNED